MKKLLFGIMIISIVLSTTIIIAESNITEEVETALENIASKEIAQSAQKYVEDFVRQEGIGAEDIDKVEKVDLNNLPKDVEIENVDDTNLAIYQIAYENFAKELFVITYSTDQLASYKNLIFKQEERQLINFGISKATKDTFLETSTGISGNLAQGQVMMREGSITGLSTNLDVEKTNEKRIEIILYINEEPFYFRNMIDASTTGKKTAYVLQSKNIVTFLPGDIISVYVNGINKGEIKNIITTVEITTN